jgi:hypothetical protein
MGSGTVGAAISSSLYDEWRVKGAAEPIESIATWEPSIG